MLYVQHNNAFRALHILKNIMCFALGMLKLLLDWTANKVF
jgi:hypothetical protein